MVNNQNVALVFLSAYSLKIHFQGFHYPIERSNFSKEKLEPTFSKKICRFFRE
jgi:hypothetical protein